MKKILIKLFNILPSCILKNKIRCSSFNFYNKDSDFKIYYKKDCYQFDFKNGINIKSYYDMSGDLKIPTKGYMKEYVPKQGDIVIDCGAYGGAFSIYVAKLIGERGRVISFEPDMKNYKLLLRNIELNGLKNIICVNKGVWSKNLFLPLHSNSWNSSFLNKEENETTVSTEVVSIDDELEKLGITKVNFIKMDVEGAELEAIKGSVKTLKNNNIKLAIASYHIVDGKETYVELEKALSRFGYKVKTSFPLHLTTYAEKL